jgi:hypothetical protein
MYAMALNIAYTGKVKVFQPPTDAPFAGAPLARSFVA